MSQKENLLKQKQQYTQKAENLLQNKGMMAISTFNAYKMYMSNEEATAKSKTRKRFRINNAVLEKRIKLAENILNNESRRISYVHKKSELNNYIKTIKTINKQLTNLQVT